MIEKIINAAGGVAQSLLAFIVLGGIFYLIGWYTDSHFVNVIGASLFCLGILMPLWFYVIKHLSARGQTLGLIVYSIIPIIVIGSALVDALETSPYTVEFAKLLGISKRVVVSKSYNTIDPDNNSASKQAEDIVSGRIDEEIKAAKLALDLLEADTIINADKEVQKAILKARIIELKKKRCENKPSLPGCEDKISKVTPNGDMDYQSYMLHGKPINFHVFSRSKNEQSLKMELSGYNDSFNLNIKTSAAVVKQTSPTTGVSYKPYCKIVGGDCVRSTDPPYRNAMEDYRNYCTGQFDVYNSAGQRLTAISVPAEAHRAEDGPSSPYLSGKFYSVSVRFAKPSDGIVVLKPVWSGDGSANPENINWNSTNPSLNNCRDYLNRMIVSFDGMMAS